MSNVQTYIRKLIFEFPEYNLSSEDKKIIEKMGKEEWITRMILQKRFRKTKVYENTKNDILNKVSFSIKKQKPLHFIILFGGYKHFWNTSHPEVDWAELFNLRFMSELFAPILAIHDPGVILDYGSEDIIITLMDNYPYTSLDKYAESFNNLIAVYSKNIPNNFKINYVRTGEKYDNEELKRRVLKMLPEKEKEWDKYPKEDLERLLHRSHRSIFWNGEKNLGKLSTEEKEKMIKRSKIIEDSFYEVEEEFLGDYFTGDNHIPIVLSWGLSEENIDHWLTLGSTYASSVDFWIGRGLLEERDGKFIPRIVSQKQYEKIQNRLKSIEIELLSLKNFQELELFEGKLVF